VDSEIFKRDEIEGVYPDQLKEEDAWKIGHGTAQFLRSLLRGFERGQTNAHSVCLGRDMRTHGKALAKALAEGITASGANVIDIGMIDTPQMYFAINHLGTCGGVQITASHNSAKYNGFKVSGLQARPIGAETGLKDIKHIAMALRHTKGICSGTVEKCDLTEDYKRHVLKFLNPNIKSLKVVIDASNGMAGKVVPVVFREVPIRIVRLNFERKGKFKHESNSLIEENLAELKAKIVATKADIGVCFDGDADRMMMVDEKGDTIPCDLLTALMVPYFLRQKQGSTIIYDLRSSWVVREEILRHGGTPRRERVGHAFMRKTMRDTHAIFGGELSGHFYYRDNFYADSAVITLVHVLNILSETPISSGPVSELIGPLRRYYASGEMNFKVEDKQAAMQGLVRKFSEGDYDDLDGVTIQFKDWWFNCRPSNTEPLLRLNVEAKEKELLENRLEELQDYLGEPVQHKKRKSCL